MKQKQNNTMISKIENQEQNENKQKTKRSNPTFKIGKENTIPDIINIQLRLTIPGRRLGSSDH